MIISQLDEFSQIRLCRCANPEAVALALGKICRLSVPSQQEKSKNVVLCYLEHHCLFLKAAMDTEVKLIMYTKHSSLSFVNTTFSNANHAFSHLLKVNVTC
jgi:hypothetical protein